MDQAVEIQYKNYKGEWGTRKILPVRMYFGKNEWHPEEQWLLEAFDIDKGMTRDFAMSGISRWSPAGPICRCRSYLERNGEHAEGCPVVRV